MPNTHSSWKKQNEMQLVIQSQKRTGKNTTFSSALYWAWPHLSNQALSLWHRILSNGVTALRKLATDSYWWIHSDKGGNPKIKKINKKGKRRKNKESGSGAVRGELTFIERNRALPWINKIPFIDKSHQRGQPYSYDRPLRWSIVSSICDVSKSDRYYYDLCTVMMSVNS